MKKLRIGVIGCGMICRTHLDAIVNNKMAELVMVCDVKASRAKDIASKYNCRYTTDYKTLLEEEIDVVHVLTPHDSHFNLAYDVISANKHCLLEKPLTIKTSDAKQLIQKIKNSDRKLGMVFQNRLNPTSQYIRNAINNEQYGAIKGIKAIVTWFRDHDYYINSDWKGKWPTEGGGVLINQAIHTLDLIQWFGGEVTSISGSYDTFILNDVIEVEDTAVMFLNFKNNTRGLLFATNNNHSDSPIEIEILFDEALLIIKDDKLYQKKQNELTLLCENKVAEGKKSYWGVSHELLIENFYDSIINNKDNYIHAHEAAQTIEILEKFYLYANKRKNIVVENTMNW